MRAGDPLDPDRIGNLWTHRHSERERRIERLFLRTAKRLGADLSGRGNERPTVFSIFALRLAARASAGYSASLSAPILPGTALLLNYTYLKAIHHRAIPRVIESDVAVPRVRLSRSRSPNLFPTTMEDKSVSDRTATCTSAWGTADRAAILRTTVRIVARLLASYSHDVESDPAGFVFLRQSFRERRRRSPEIWATACATPSDW